MTEIHEATLARRQQIVAAATATFLRYGYARTTMGDVARAAGISRPTLYAAFPDKEQVFDAVIRGLVEAKIAQIRQQLASLPSIAEKLSWACTSWGVEGYELVRANPDARDVFDLGFCAVRDSYEVFEKLVTEILQAQWPRHGQVPALPDAARMLAAAIKGFKDLARDSDELRRMIASLAAMVASQLTSE
ncbi:TetR/AcrR family transcriptional regulator [Janthinobacterium sp. Mn2066]|uniref:TetR/AcrR family transcriptional regulator n=1 Tax=Janthinobacterium sp. Mn2066 TaxID=3395264 RepID=UPI003BC70CB2